MGMVGDIIDWIKNAISKVVDFVIRVIEGVLDFVRHVVSYFRNLNLNPNKHTPFIANANSPEFKQMLRRAPNKNVGIFKGVYNEETDEIEHSEFVEADALDSQTKNVMQNEPLVVLS